MPLSLQHNNHHFKTTNKMGKVIRETFEEVAKKKYGTSIYEVYEVDAFVEGAKWMQERMYSEEDMRKAFIAGGNSQIEEDDDYGTEYDAYMEEWFEQFKIKKCQ
jgi:hypothetical protein